MAQPALVVAPDDRRPCFFSGTVNSAAGSLWFFNNSNPAGRAEMIEFGKIFPSEGATWVFNGLLFIPTVESYLAPASRLRGVTTPTRSGVHLPRSLWGDYDWTLGKAQGLHPYVTDEGEFAAPAPTFKLFDRKCQFRCTERRTLNGEDDVEPVLEEIRHRVVDAPVLQLWAAHGVCVFVVEVEFAPREYPPPPVVTPRPAVVDRDDGDDTRKPRRRKKQQED